MKTSTAKGFVVRTATASLFVALAFWLGTSLAASRSSGGAGHVLWRVFDAPVSALNLLLPPSIQSGCAMQFESSTYCFPQSQGTEFLRYFRVGVPAWLALLYLPAGCRQVARRVRAPGRIAHAK